MSMSDNESAHDYSGRGDGGAFEGQSVEELSSTSSGSGSDVEVVGTAVVGEDTMDVQPLSTVPPILGFKRSGLAGRRTQPAGANMPDVEEPLDRANQDEEATPSDRASQADGTANRTDEATPSERANQSEGRTYPKRKRRKKKRSP